MAYSRYPARYAPRSYRPVERTTDPRKLAGTIQGMWAFWSGQGMVGASIDGILSGVVTESPARLPGYDEGMELARELRALVLRGTAPNSADNQFGYFVAGTEVSFADAAGGIVDSVTGGTVGSDVAATIDNALAAAGF